MDNIQKFLLELGRGFAFVGREYRLLVGDTEQFIDMLFYNIQKHCYVVIEIKTRAFDPGDMGQLGTYIAATDGILRADNDNPTIGLLICKHIACSRQYINTYIIQQQDISMTSCCIFNLFIQLMNHNFFCPSKNDFQSPSIAINIVK